MAPRTIVVSRSPYGAGVRGAVKDPSWRPWNALQKSNEARARRVMLSKTAFQGFPITFKKPINPPLMFRSYLPRNRHNALNDLRENTGFQNKNAFFPYQPYRDMAYPDNKVTQSWIKGNRMMDIRRWRSYRKQFKRVPGRIVKGKFRHQKALSPGFWRNHSNLQKQVKRDTYQHNLVRKVKKPKMTFDQYVGKVPY